MRKWIVRIITELEPLAVTGSGSGSGLYASYTGDGVSYPHTGYADLGDGDFGDGGLALWLNGALRVEEDK